MYAILIVLSLVFSAHEGPDTFVGAGGEKTVHEGVDFWLNGASPPRKFRLLGYLTADINSAGLNGMIATKRLPGRVAKQARERGADAVIVLDEATQTAEGPATAYTSGNSTRVFQKTFAKTKTRYALVQYVAADASLPE